MGAAIRKLSPPSPNGHLAPHVLPGSAVAHPDALEIRNLSAGYSHDLALRDISFGIQAGKRIGLLGPNGAGKSTLFKAIMGILPAVQGEVTIHGQPLASAKHTPQGSLRVAYVPQFEEIDWKFPVSVYDVVMMGRTRHIGWLRWPRKGDVHDRRVHEALDRVEMGALIHRQIGELSGGQKRRVFMARALAQEADILLLDEPFAGVDARAQHAILRVIENLSAEGVTTLLATHDLGMASAHFDKLILLNKRLIAFGTPAEVFRPEVLREAFGGQIAIWNVDSAEGHHTMLVTDHCCP